MAAPDAGDVGLPDAGAVRTRGERVRLGVPTVEIADHRHALRVRRPHREASAVARQLTAHPLVEPAMGAFAEEIRVLRGEMRARRVHLLKGRVRTADRMPLAYFVPPDDRAVLTSVAPARALRHANCKLKYGLRPADEGAAIRCAG